MTEGEKDNLIEAQIERLRASGPLPQDPVREFDALHQADSPWLAFLSRYWGVLVIALIVLVIGRWRVSSSGEDAAHTPTTQPTPSTATLDQASLALQNMLKPSASPDAHVGKGIDEKARLKLERQLGRLVTGKPNPFADHMAPTPRATAPHPVRVVERPLPLPPMPTPPPPRAILKLVGVVDGETGPTALVEAQAPGVPNRLRLKKGDKVVAQYRVANVLLDRVEIKGPFGHYFLSFQPLEIELPRQ